MAKTKTSVLMGLSFFALATSAFAAETSSATPTSQSFDVSGNVPSMCSAGSVSDGGAFPLGVLVNTTTGFLKTDLSAPNQTLSGGFCNSRSQISISATPMSAQTFTGTPPDGFSRIIDYTATASGWTTTPATYSTALTESSNTAATQSRDTAFTGNIVVSVGNFSTNGGATLRPIADDSFLGYVTVTLSAVTVSD